MKYACLNFARLALGAWIGAAAIFVVTAVHEVQSPKFTSREKSQLALLRFPTYYQFGFTLVPATIIFGGLAVGHPALGKRRSLVFFVLMAAVLVVMFVDYVTIYGPLNLMLHAEESGAARPENFQKYHEASKTVNTIDVGLCFVAALVLCLPEPKRRGERGLA